MMNAENLPLFWRRVGGLGRVVPVGGLGGVEIGSVIFLERQLPVGVQQVGEVGGHAHHAFAQVRLPGRQQVGMVLEEALPGGVVGAEEVVAVFVVRDLLLEHLHLL